MSQHGTRTVSALRTSIEGRKTCRLPVDPFRSSQRMHLPLPLPLRAPSFPAPFVPNILSDAPNKLIIPLQPHLLSPRTVMTWKHSLREGLLVVVVPALGRFV